jgi:hypothetical protein
MIQEPLQMYIRIRRRGSKKTKFVKSTSVFNMKRVNSLFLVGHGGELQRGVHDTRDAQVQQHSGRDRPRRSQVQLQFSLHFAISLRKILCKIECE